MTEEKQKHDIVIPLGVKSYQQKNNEILIAVTSIRKFCSSWLNRIIIVTQIDPIKELGDDIIWLKHGDIYNHDKDANIIGKIRYTIENVPDLTEDFMMWSDDQFVTKETNWSDCCVPRYMKVYSPETRAYFDDMAKKRTWWRRLRKCLDRFGYGAKLWNPHIPMPLNKNKFIEMCRKFPYRTDDGITIYSLYFNFIKEEGKPNFDEFHCQGGETDWKGGRWVGFFDSSMRNATWRNYVQEFFGIEFK